MFDIDDDPADEPAAAPEAAPSAPAKAPKLRYSDEQFLRIVDEECRRSVGFGEGDTGELARVRIKAQEYRQGRIVDLQVIKGRSTAVDSTLSDAVDTVMPDVMEVFFGGDDVVTFDADGEGDESQAREESDAVNHVVFNQNDAFRAFHDAIQDSLLNRTGVFHWWWEEDQKPIGTHVAENAAQAAVLASLVGQHIPGAQAAVEQRDDGSVALQISQLRGKVCFKAVPSEDFTVASDTVILRKSAYCALRDRPRVQDLIERGVDPKLARNLPHYTSRQDEMERARDEAGENDRAEENGIDDMRVVEVRTHYVRVDADGDGQVEIWRVETDSAQTVLLQKECVSQIPFGALTPYLSAHRFYGESLADKLFEVMRIKTVLLRMLLDSGYFAMNQRMEVAEDAANEFTISDLLNNAPNVPVRSKTGNAVRALQAGSLGFEPLAAMEYMSTVAEGRSGVVRNAQGLNPDTLHDTATGAQALIAAAQKRVRMICRVFAETGVKDLFLGVHQMLREQYSDDHAPMNMKAGQAWSQVKPQDWSEREGLTVHVGVGSAGRDRDLAVQEQAIGLTEKVVELQGGLHGPFVTPTNVFNRLKAFSRAIGEKSPELYWSDPAAPPAPGAPGEGPPQPPPNPAMIQAQNEAQIEQAKLQAQTQASQLQAQNDLQIAREKMAGELQLKREEMQLKIQLEREKAQQELQLQREEMQAEFALKKTEIANRTSNSTQLDEAVADLPGGVS